MLGSWVSHQRDAFQRGELPKDRVSRLEALSGWMWNLQDEYAEQGFSVLSAFVAREGHSLVPARFVESGVTLGRWVFTQRANFHRGALSEDRIARFQALPGWTWNPLENQWEVALSNLDAFVDREGHARVPNGHVESGFRLAGWVNVQRGSFRRGELSNERISRLEAFPGWSWNPHDEQWEEAFVGLISFVDQEGHSRVPVDHIDESGFKLGRWLSTQRNNFRSGSLSKSRIERLEALPGWTWNLLDHQWEEGFVILSTFVDREGHARVPQRFQESRFQLGLWTANQRASFRRGAISKERAERLEALPGWQWGISKNN
jgi:hypothetical protein